MKYIFILLLFLPFSIKSKEITMICEISKKLVNGNEERFTPQKKFLKYKDSLVAKRDVLQKFEGQWFSWCSDESTKIFNEYFKENNIPIDNYKEERVLNKLSAKCKTTFINRNNLQQQSIINVDFEFLERTDAMTLFNEDGEIQEKGILYYKCQQN